MQNKYLNEVIKLSKENKWTKIYGSIVNRGIERGHNRKELKLKFTYIEAHHILPKSFRLGGEKDLDNLVFLTAREHFIVHLCAVKMFSGLFAFKMNYALQQLRASNKYQNKRYFNSKLYNFIKTNKKPYTRLYLLDKVKYIYIDDHNEIDNFINKGWSLKMTPEFKVGRVGNMLGRKHSDKTKKKMSDSSIGKPKLYARGVPRTEAAKIKTAKTLALKRLNNLQNIEGVYSPPN